MFKYLQLNVLLSYTLIGAESLISKTDKYNNLIETFYAARTFLIAEPIFHNLLQKWRSLKLDKVSSFLMFASS